MSEAAQSRREALRGAALGAGALAAAGLLRPGLATAQSTDDEDLRDFLVGAISLEQLAVLAYATTARAGDPDLRRTMETFRDQEQAHANALRKALDSLGFDLPAPPDSTTDRAAFEDVEGLDEDLAGQLTKLLDELDKLSKPDEYLDYLLALEAKQIDYYTANGPGAESVDLTTTCAEIAGCQAQHSLVLGQARGKALAEAAAAPARTAQRAIPAAS